MAAVTKNLAFGITASTSFEPPFLLAKRFSTLDHLTQGRIGWNIVTSWKKAAFKAIGIDTPIDHDERYEQADEYLRLLYKCVSQYPAPTLKDFARLTIIDSGKAHGATMPSSPTPKTMLTSTPTGSEPSSTKESISTSNRDISSIHRLSVHQSCSKQAHLRQFYR
jgi:alkanesulfonate monooxygenase SsuD/methylene tetrahydromethanopterin reductase-like flavin-dependent oxidoreductase (luciferase family)